jgi:hypothetical protein
MHERTRRQDLANDNRPLRRFATIAALALLAIVGFGDFMMAAPEPPAEPVAGKTDAAVPTQTLDLKKFYNTPASRFTNGQFPWAEVPRYSKKFGNVPLDIGGMICLWGESNAKYGFVFREKIDDIVVDRKFETLYVYHCAFFQSPDGTPVYRLTMHYADGSVRESTICYGIHVRDWYHYPKREPVDELSDPKSKIVWRGEHPDGTPDKPMKLRFGITSIRNPKPSVEVKSISLASAKGNSAGCILAMTTGPADLLKMEPEEESASGKEPSKE